MTVMIKIIVRTLAVLTLTTLLGACSQSDDCDPALDCNCNDIADCALSERDLLLSNFQYYKDKWESLEESTISFDINIACECLEELNYSVYVSEDNELIYDTNSETFASYIYFNDHRSLHTPAALFSLIEEYIWDADFIDVEFDPETYLPTLIDIDKDLNVADDQIKVTLTKVASSLTSSCTANYVYGLEIQVIDKDTLNNLSCDSEVKVYNENYNEYLNSPVSCTSNTILEGLGETSGSFSVDVSSNNYESQTIQSVDVMRDVCHVHTKTITVELTQ